MVDTYTGDVPNLTQTQPEFDTNTQNILDYIAGLAPQLNAWVGAYIQSTTTTSTTENDLGTGSKTFTVESGKGYKEDMTVRASAGGGNFMDGNVTSYSGTSLTVNFTTFTGPGTFDEWDIFLTLSGSDVTLGSNTFTGPQIVPDQIYSESSWNGNLSVPTKNAVRDVIEALIASLPQLENASSDPSFTSAAANKAATPQWVQGYDHLKAWVNFNGTGTVAIRASKNVSSVTDNGVGDYTINFTNPISDANYAAALNGGNDTGTIAAGNTFWGSHYSKTASAFRIVCAFWGGGSSTRVAADFDQVNVAILR
jgi:hypothetical protein